MIACEGLTRSGYIAAQERLHGALAFTYTPMIPEQVDAIDDKMKALPAEKWHELVRAAIVQNLKEWDLTWPESGPWGQKGEAVPIRLETVRRLDYRPYSRLYRIISGVTASDAVPNATPEEEEGYCATLLEAATSGGAPGAIETEREVGN